MTTLFKPTGSLDLSINASDLPSQADGSNETSGAMQRCKNLRLDENGVAKTRDGSTVLDSSLSTYIHKMIEQSGYRYNFASTIIYRNTTSLATGLTDAKWSAMLYNSFNATTENVFALNGTDRKRIEGTSVYEWGVAAPTGAITLSGASSGNLTGDYNAVYTFLRKENAVVVYESDPSPAATTAVTLTAQSLMVTIDVETYDTQITHLRLYRTLTDGLIYYQDVDFTTDTLDDYGYCHTWESTDVYIAGTGNKITDSSGYIYSWEPTYTVASDDDNYVVRTSNIDPFIIVTDTADTALGSEVEYDHDRPPLGNFCIGPNYNGTCFIIKDNLLYYCSPKQPEYWPTDNYLEMSALQFPGQTATFWNGQLYYFNKVDVFLVQGTGANTFFPLQMSAVTGAQGPECVASVSGLGIYHVGVDGIYLFSSGHDKKVSQEHLERTFRGETVNGVPGVDRDKLSKSWLVYYAGKLYFGYAGTADTYPQNVIVFNFAAEKLWYYDYGIEISTVTIDETNARLLAGDTSGNTWVLEDRTTTTDNGTQISWEVESKDFTLQTRKHFPRWIKYDVNASDSNCTATGAVVVDGTTLQSHTLTANRQTRRRLITTGNGDRVSNKITGSGPVTIYAMEFE